MAKRRTAAEVLQKLAAESSDLRAAAKPARAPAKAQTEDATLLALRRNVGRVVSLPVNVLVIEKNVRKILDAASADFTALVNDIRQSGVKQNIAVELREDAQGGYRLVVVFGQRRVLAARKAGAEMIPALLVQPNDPAERIFLGLAENILRTEMHPLDKAEAYQELIEAGWSTQMLAEKFERQKRTVQGFLRLARFPQKAKAIIRDNPEPFTTHLLFNRFLGKAWQDEAELVQALRQVLAGRHRKAAGRRPPLAREASKLAQLAARRTGVTCKARGTTAAGQLTLTWRNREELDKLNKLFQP